MTVNGFAENFGPAVEAVCLALLAALGLWLCCRGLGRVCRVLKAQLGGVDSLTRAVLLALCVLLAPFASSKFTGGMGAPHVRTSARAPSPTSGEDAPGTFSLPAIEGASLEWEGGSNGGASATGNVFTARATCRGYPTHNGGFGKKTATFTLGGLTVSQDFEVFFPSDGTHHPACPTCPNCPNWFYYWREGNVCGITDEMIYANLGTDVCGDYNPHTNVIRLGPAAVQVTHEIPVPNYERQITELPQVDPAVPPVAMTNWLPTVGHFLIGAAGVGIRSVAAAVKHEMRHREVFLSHPENATNQPAPGDVGVHFDENPDDEDWDGVWNVDEISGRWGIVSNEKEPDTFNMARISQKYEDSGDDEIRAWLAERESLESAYHVDWDWCNPGCQSEVRRGPMRDESIGGSSR